MDLLTINEQILLIAILHMKDNAYGVTIRERILEVTGKQLLYGTLYNSLDNLVRKGYVNTNKGHPTPERGGRSKVFYILTEKGKTALKESRKFQTALWQSINDFALE